MPFGIEKVGNSLGAELDGYAQFVNSQEEYQLACMEVLIESNFIDNIKVSPMQRLVGILGTSAYMVHTANASKTANQKAKLSAKIDETKMKAFDGI